MYKKLSSFEPNKEWTDINVFDVVFFHFPNQFNSSYDFFEEITLEGTTLEMESIATNAI